MKAMERTLTATSLTDALEAGFSEAGFSTEETIDEKELAYLIRERKEVVKRVVATAPRGKFSSHTSWSHNGDYLEALNKSRRVKAELSEFIAPHVEALRAEGHTWKAVAETLNVSAAIIKEYRETL